MGCTWDFVYSACSEDEKKLIEGLDPNTQEYAEALAKDILDAWTGGVFGLCEAFIRPCKETRDCDTPASLNGSGALASAWRAVDIAGNWYQMSGGCSCRSVCSCDTVEYLELPFPTHEVKGVRIDGELLPVESWRLEGHRYLVRTDGGQFPTCQDMNAPASQPDTFEIELAVGVPLPVAGKVAAGMLALQFMKALCNDSTCELPQRVQTITREGVTVAVEDSFDDMLQGRTGIRIVDSWVASVTQPRFSGFTVMSPDTMPRPRKGGYYVR